MEDNNYILIAYVNQFYTNQLNLAVLNTNNNKHYWIFNDEIDALTKENVFGIAGLAKFNDKYIVAYQSSPVLIIVLNNDFSVHSHYKTNEIIDIHSVFCSKNKIYVTSTGSDSLFEIIIDDKVVICGIKKIWKHPKSKGEIDEFHVNSVVKFKDSIFVSNFGFSPILKDSSNKNKGTIININNDEVIVDELGQPHTLALIDKELYYCESGTGLLHKLNGIPIHIGGYLRGLTYDKNNIYVGRSGKRIKSKSSGEINSNIKSYTENAEIIVIERNTNTIKETLGLGEFGNEIYDLVKLNSFNEKQFEMINRGLHISHLKNRIYTHHMKNEENILSKKSFFGFKKKQINFEKHFIKNYDKKIIN